MITLTKELIKNGASLKGGYTKAQLNILGIDWPAPNGWLKSLIGKSISDADYNKYIHFKKHYNPEDVPAKIKPDIIKDRNLKKITIYTDGGCIPNPGIGGWGAVLIYKDTVKKISGGNPWTTNNRMELTALIEALKILKEPCEIRLYSDSKYVFYLLRRKKGDNKPNADLFNTLQTLKASHIINFSWVKGHSGIQYNEECDKMAELEIMKLTETPFKLN